MKHLVASRRRSGPHRLVALATLLLGALWLLGAPAAGAYEVAPGVTTPVLLGVDSEAPSATLPARRRVVAAIRRFFVTLPRLALARTPAMPGAMPVVGRARDDAGADPGERVGWRTVDPQRGPPAALAAPA